MSDKYLSGKQIKRMIDQGLWYIDDDGAEQFIDFATCFENYAQVALSPEKLEEMRNASNKSDTEWEEYVERIKRLKYVGDRNILTLPWADGPYIEFFTKPPIRFKFETEEQFQTVRNYIERTGWRTGDRS